MTSFMPGEQEIKNDTLYDIDNKPGYIDYTVEIELLRCGACGRRGISNRSDKCPGCNSYDLIPDIKEKGFKSKYRR